MQQRYFSLSMFSFALILIVAVSSCSKNEEDIAAPSITIIQPAENDTVQLVNGFIIIKVSASDDVNICDMEMDIRDESGKVLYTYDADDLEDQSYTCVEKFYPKNINHVTQMKLSVTFENEYKDWKTKSINFYVKP